MRFFRMRSPEYSSTHQDLFINGNLEHVYRFPGVSCLACRTTYGGSRILSDPAPRQILNDKRFKSRWPVSDEEHAAMQKEIAGYLNKEFISFVTFRPGDNFQPACLSIPSKPTADFLWPNIRSFVVSERMKKMVFEELSGAVDIVPIELQKVGKPKPNVTAGTASLESTTSGRSRLESLDSDELVGPYYQILVRAESDYPKGGLPLSTCSVCKREYIEEEKRELIMKEDMWRGQPIFFLKTTLYVVVTEALAEKIRKAHATNVDFVPY